MRAWDVEPRLRAGDTVEADSDTHYANEIRPALNAVAAKAVDEDNGTLLWMAQAELVRLDRTYGTMTSPPTTKPTSPSP